MLAIKKPQPVVPQPRLSDRNLARFVCMPASRQMRFLHDQKYPRGAPQVFVVPYYGRAMNGIRDVMKRGFAGIIDARSKLEGIAQATKRANNQRVLEAFVVSPHAKRKLIVVSAHRHQAYKRMLEVRFSPHVVAREDDEIRYLYFHERREHCNPEQARLTLEFGYWVLQQNDVNCNPEQLELIDLFGGKHFKGEPTRSSTLKLLDEIAHHIESQWATIDP